MENRIHELNFQNDENTSFTINDAENADSFAYGIELNSEANTQGQLVTGRYNISKDKAVIVGNGGNNLERKNIYELDWDGNAEFEGTIKTKGAEVATLNDLSDASFGSLRKLVEPIEIITNLDAEGSGSIQYAGEKRTIGIEGVLSSEHGGTGRQITSKELNPNQIMLGNFKTLAPPPLKDGETDYKESIPKWDVHGNLITAPLEEVIDLPLLYVNPFTHASRSNPIKTDENSGLTKLEIGVTTDFPQNVVVDLASTSTQQSSYDDMKESIGIKLVTESKLPINKIAPYYTNTDGVLLGTIKNTQGQNETSWLDAATVSTILGLPIIKRLAGEKTGATNQWKIQLPMQVDTSTPQGFIILSIELESNYRTGIIQLPQGVKFPKTILFPGGKDGNLDNETYSTKCTPSFTNNNSGCILQLTFDDILATGNNTGNFDVNPITVSALLIITPS